MKPITITIFTWAEDDENHEHWNVAEWLNDPHMEAWTIKDGHEEPKSGSDHFQVLG